MDYQLLIEVTVGLVYFIIMILIVSPLALFILLSLKFGVKLNLSSYYLYEVIAVLLLATVGHFYYYIFYELNIFPSLSYLTTFLGASLFGLIIVFFIGFIARFMKKGKGLSTKELGLLCIFLVVLFSWLIPLGQKYYYVKRLNMMEEIFTNKDTNKIKTDGDIMIGLVESEYDPIMRPRYRSPRTYNNYFYIKNNGNTPYEGSIYLILYNEKNEVLEIKLLRDVEVAANTVQLLVEQENQLTKDEWSKRSFHTKQRVETFEAVIAQK